jgi:hypothetical protein
MTDLPPVPERPDAAAQAPVVPAQTPLTPPPQMPATSSTQTASASSPLMPVSPEWRRDTRRGAYAAMTLGLLVGYTWIAATRDWGWPLIPAALILLGGIYVLLTTYYDRLPPVLGRERIPVDHSTKYTLSFIDQFAGWSVNEDQPDRLDVQLAITLGNGGTGIIQVHLDDLQVQMMGIKQESNIFITRDFRLLPGQTKRFWAPAIRSIPEGATGGEIEYEITYGPPTGFPKYIRRHHIAIMESQPITLEMVKNKKFDNVTLYNRDMQAESDEDKL